MAKTPDNERELIRQGAEGARPMLLKLAQQKAALEQRMAALQALVDADETLSGTKKRTVSEADGTKRTKRVRKGDVSKHIDAVLVGGASLDEPAIREQITKAFSVEYGRPTVYTALRRGVRDHKYVKDGAKFSLNPLMVAKAE